MSAHPAAAFALSLSLALAAARTTAQPRPPEAVRLTVTRDARSLRCPDAASVSALLRGRLHREAVRDDASADASLRFVRERTRYAVTLALRRAGQRATIRRLHAEGDDCARLADAAALVLALAIDPLHARTPVATPTPPAPSPVEAPPVTETPPVAGTPPVAETPPILESPPVLETPPAPPRPRPRVVTSAPRPASLQIAALASLSVGVAPGLLGELLRPGLAERVTALVGPWGFAVGMTLDAPGRLTDAARDASVDVLPIQWDVGACRRFGRRVVVPVCALTALGLVVAWGDGYAPDRTDVGLSLAFGARAGVEVPLRGRWWFVASADLRGVAVRPSLRVGGTAGGQLWTAPPWGATLSLGVAWANR